ncbi:hypothetical protein BV25DRAFT_1868884 [Artomyces pyxidatus]|uniref:Uncharacterized protein n=1 Tax=Artomyces pyxidatus TaxID=48021 RepID=A0ACB8T9W4_9AGAM|nr:hypothetical protein BV25DRAFT_1868884 [Artomyces pyxidatus]
MSRSLLLATLVASLAWFVWRNGRIVRTLLSTPELPVAYYAGGKHDNHCEISDSDGMKFCEDARFWDRLDEDGRIVDRVLLASCDPSRLSWNTVMGPLKDPQPRGAIWMYRIRDNAAVPQRVVFEGYPNGHDFHPLGFDTSTLFVTNHARERSTIEQFTLSWDTPYRAQWVQTLSIPEFVSPNSITLTSRTSFYLSQDHYFTRRLPGIIGKTIPLMESLLALPLGWVAHVAVSTPPDQKTSYSIAVPHVPFANGVALSPVGGGTLVAVASTTLGEIHFYTRNPATHALTLADRVSVPFAPDNIAFDDAGVLLVAGHPHFPSLAAVANNRSAARSPSWILTIGRRESETLLPEAYDLHAPVSASRRAPVSQKYDVQTVYQSNGTAFQSSSTALRDTESGKIYATGLYEAGILVCSPQSAAR